MEIKVYLDKFTDGDFEKYYELVGNEEVMAMITEKTLTVNEAVNKFNLLLINNKIHESFGCFKIIELSSNKFIGLAKLKITERNSKEAELGYMLLPKYWGLGIGSKVAKLLMKKATEDGILNTIIAFIDPCNVASRKILIRNGFISDKICDMEGLPTEIFFKKI